MPTNPLRTLACRAKPPPSPPTSPPPEPSQDPVASTSTDQNENKPLTTSLIRTISKRSRKSTTSSKITYRSSPPRPKVPRKSLTTSLREVFGSRSLNEDFKRDGKKKRGGVGGLFANEDKNESSGPIQTTSDVEPGTQTTNTNVDDGEETTVEDMEFIHMTLSSKKDVTKPDTSVEVAQTTVNSSDEYTKSPEYLYWTPLIQSKLTRLNRINRSLTDLRTEAFAQVGREVMGTNEEGGFMEYTRKFHEMIGSTRGYGGSTYFQAKMSGLDDVCQKELEEGWITDWFTTSSEEREKDGGCNHDF